MEACHYIPPSPAHSLCKNAAKEGPSNTCETENRSDEAYKCRNLGWFDAERNEDIASTSDTSSASTLDGSTDNESSAVVGNACSKSIQKISPHSPKSRDLPHTRLPNSNTRTDERKVVFSGKYLYAFPQKATNAARHMKKAEPYQPT